MQNDILDNTLVTSIQKMYTSKAGYGINDFTNLLIFYICFSLPQIIIKIFFSISESFVSVKRVHLFYLLFIIIFVHSKQSLDSPTLMTLILPTCYSVHIPYGFQEFHFLLKIQFIHVQRAIKYNFVNSFVN